MFLSIPEIAISKCLCVLISPSIILLFKKLMLYNLTPLFFFWKEVDLYYVSKDYFVMAAFKMLYLLSKLGFGFAFFFK